MTEKDNVKESTRQGRALALLAVVLVLALGGAAFVFWRRARSSAETLAHVRSTWQMRCDSAKLQAVNDVRSAVQFARGGRWEAGAASGPARAVDLYVRTCVGERNDTRIQDMAGKLANLMFALYMARKLDELEALADQLANKPLDQWPTISLPAAPPLPLVLSGGDPSEADKIDAAAKRSDQASGSGSAASP
jgi:hypothetical protein